MVTNTIYSLNTRVWINELKEQYNDQSISLGNIPEEEITQLQNLHFDWVWLMGVWHHSSIDEEFLDSHEGLQSEIQEALPSWEIDDIVGSPYAINDYSVNPSIGTENELTKFRNQLHDHDIQLMVDFVPNHFGYQSELVYEHPEYFIHHREKPDNEELFSLVDTTQGELWIAHGKDPHFPPWDDTFQLDHFNPDSRRYMREKLLDIAELSDGVRCDMAMLLLNSIFRRTWNKYLVNEELSDEFWNKAIKDVKSKYPGFILNAEAYWNLEWELQQQGFDFVYDKPLYDRLIHESPSSIKDHLEADINYQKKLCRFVENHDEPRLFRILDRSKAIAASVIIMTLPGLTLLHQGQLVGRKIDLPVQLDRSKTEQPDNELLIQYQELLSLIDKSIIKEGGWHIIETKPVQKDSIAHENLLAWLWETSEEIMIICINYSKNKVKGTLPLPRHPLLGNSKITLYDHISGESYEYDAAILRGEGVFVELDSYDYHIFSIN